MTRVQNKSFLLEDEKARNELRKFWTVHKDMDSQPASQPAKSRKSGLEKGKFRTLTSILPAIEV
jgi:hypothetical protein